jgi:hypothetical protein
MSKLYRLVRAGEALHPKVSTDDVLDDGPRTLLQNNRNWLCVICGPTGTGKSWTSLKLAQMLDPEFSLQRVVFSTEAFMDVFHLCHAGQVIIFEESEELNARRAMKESNVQMSNILSMLRFTQISVIFNLPSISMIDINARRLMHSYLYTVEFDRTRAPPWQRNKSGVFWYNVRNTRLPSKNSDDQLKYVNPIVKGVKVRKVWFEAPTPTLLAEYEALKHRTFWKRLSEAQGKLGLTGAVVGSEIRADRDAPPTPEPQLDGELPADLLENDRNAMLE